MNETTLHDLIVLKSGLGMQCLSAMFVVLAVAELSYHIIEHIMCYLISYLIIL